MNNKEEMELLKETYRNASLTVKALKILEPKAYDEEFAAELLYQEKGFEQFQARLEDAIEKKGGEPENVSNLVSALTWTSIQGKMVLNVSTPYLASLMIQGNTRSITDIMRKKHENRNAGAFANELSEDLMDFEEDSIEKLKRYL